MSPRAFSVLLVVAFLASGTAAAEGRRSKLDRVLREAALSGEAQRVIVQTRPGTRAALKRALLTHGDVVEAEHPGLDALTAIVHAEDLAALEADPTVLGVSVDADVTSFGSKNHSKDKKSSADDNPLRATLGLNDRTLYRGTGVNVAILDSGIEPNRDLAPNLAGFWDFTRGGIPTRAFDDYGHGTHVAGLIASGGYESAHYGGVAPAVRLYGLKVLDKNGRGRSSHVVKALEWIVGNKISNAPGAVKIDIVNLSLGHPIYEAAESDPLVRAVENAVRAGIVVVTAAGNRGLDERGNPGYAGITSPANAPSAITVGAVDTKNTANHSDDRVAYFSSRGPAWFDGFAKPEIVAPGVGLTSDAAENSSLYSAYPQLRLGRNNVERKFATLSGTSMAAAVATGVAALALEASRHANGAGNTLAPNALKAVLQYSALPVERTDGQPYEALAQGAGQVNGDGAITLALAINTETPVGQSWMREQVSPFSLIDGDTLEWSRTLIWNDSLISGSDVLSRHSELWDDNIVWGTSCDTDDVQCLASVWGPASEAENIVWGTLAWAADIVESNRVIGLILDDDNIVWGTIDGLTEDNIVWGTFDGDNIVWGTLARRNSGGPVWGLIDEDNIVWGTLPSGTDVDADDDNIVWGTLLNLTAGSPKGGRQ